ncbi:ABC transporter substrate-binding protein [uncultured Alsobacter sp.]|uniref:ABC transporter substrate-binding protein n=1 Tax=uncultured Alsobacter sp. TaxID=1748258 RepID=UPI0025E57029|nr:ABC transporter substrate-binding protein [uncultured Alsobacter sp.]
MLGKSPVRAAWSATAGTVALVGAALLSSTVLAQDLKSVPRNRTLISQGWDFYNQVPSPTNFSPYAGVLLHQRNSLHYTVNEMLFYTNHNTNEIIPWQAESFSYNPTFTEVTLKLRDGVTWSDGKPFTAEDVTFSLGMLRGAAPDLVMSAAIKEWVASEEAVDPRTVRIKLTKPGPRWAQDFLATGQAARFVVVPKHIWQGQDPKTFGFFDVAKGWPVGTGPYKLVKADSGSLVYDRRDDWWAVKAKVVPAMPAPERIVYRPATVDALPQLFSNNEVDIGRALQVGNFEASKARNANIASWNAQGPVWGAADGCTFRVVFNNQKAPWDSVEVRRAINSALNRDQIVDLAFEGSMPKALVPFASYDGVKAYTSQMKDIIDAAALDKTDAKKTEELLKSKGFAKGSDGKWTLPGGQAWPITILTQNGDPIAPVVAKQLQAAGFDAVFRPTQDAAYFDALGTGNFEVAVNPHCGSIYDPWQTLEHFHGKYAAAPGAKGTNPRAPTRYNNPELNALLDKMEARQPSPKDAEYVGLVKAATTIILRDLPQITVAEEMHALTFNTTYWTGFPNAKDPYVAPYLPWEGFNLVVSRLKPRS